MFNLILTLSKFFYLYSEKPYFALYERNKLPSNKGTIKIKYNNSFGTTRLLPDHL